MYSTRELVLNYMIVNNDLAKNNDIFGYGVYGFSNIIDSYKIILHFINVWTGVLVVILSLSNYIVVSWFKF